MLTKKDKKKRYNKATGSRKGHQFSAIQEMNKMTKTAFTDDFGGATSGALGAVAGAIGTGMEAAKLHGVEEAQEAIDAQANFKSMAADEDALIAEMTGSHIKNDYSATDFIQSGGDFAKTLINGTISGAASGASAGPWTAIAGGIANAGAALIGRAVAKNEGKVEANDKSLQATLANEAADQAKVNKAEAFDQAADQRAARAYAAYGGGINTPKFSDFPSEVTEFNTGGTHEENPYDGIPQGIAPDGLPNLVEEGEVKYDNYIFSDRLMLNKNDKKKYKFLKGKTYADAAKAIKKQLGIDERPNDLIAKTDLEEHLNILSTLQEAERAKRGLRGENRMMYKNGGHIFDALSPITIDEAKVQADSNALENYAHAVGQAMPAIGNAVGLIGNLFDKPKYEHTKNLTQSETPVTPITYTPTHQDIKLPRLDKNFYMNKADAQAAATRRAIREQTASNPYASSAALLAADYQGNAQRGDIRRQATEMDANTLLQEAQFNSTGRRADAEGLLKVASTNAALQDKALTRQAEKDALAARLNMAEDQAWDTANSANLTGLFDNLGAMGKESRAEMQATMHNLLEAGQVDAAQALGKKMYGQDFILTRTPIKADGKQKYGGKLKKKKGYTI